VTTVATAKVRHPQGKSLAEALREDEPRKKAQKGLIRKTSTLVSAGLGDGVAEAGPLTPTEEQLARINQFTRSPKSAEEVVAFSTLSMNDLPDRDDDQFKKQCVKDFASLEQPFSPVGKSYLVGHNHSGLGVGRIFGVDTKTVKGATFLTNEVYIPNTETYAGFIEGIDFGINWAVSVGVMLGKDTCSVCEAPFSSWGYWCSNGHDKGMFYDPKSEETDSWGYPAPCDPGTKGAVKCLRLFDEPRDFDELSQVYLGAQYDAKLDKGIAKILKSAAATDLPIIGLSMEEAKLLEMRHEDEKVSEARMNFEVITEEDGTQKWTDDNDLVWVYNPEEGEVMSLGKSSASDDEEGEEEDSGEGTGDAEALGSDEEVGNEDEDGRTDEDEPEGVEDEVDSGEVSGEVGDEAKGVSKKDLLSKLVRAKAPQSMLEAVSESDDPLAALVSASVSAHRDLEKTVAELTPRAEIGKAYIESLKADAINWYVKAHQLGADQPVKTETFQRILNNLGDDIDLIKEVTEDNRAQAQAKFPASVRRSTVDTDPNVRDELQPVSLSPETGQKVRNLHG
jgi:hypothetical protein